MGVPSSRPGRALAITMSALVTGSALVTTTAAAQPAVPVPAPPVSWVQCDDASLADVPAAQRHLFTCAKYPVPIDHDDPGKGMVDIAMMRRAASTPDQRVGALFLNPGGPGGAGFARPVTAPDKFDPAVVDRFDVIGFDPRGVDRSTRLRCYTSPEQAEQVQSRASSVPISQQQVDSTLGAFQEQGQLCAANAGELLRHMSTKDVARDMDLMRQGLGEQQLNYVGFSYGTLLGATYVNLFPEQSRAIVLDGNVDPALRTSDGVEYDRQRAQGFELALDAFLQRCADTADRCAFSAGDPRAKFDEIRDRLRVGPLALPDGSNMTIDAFTESVSGALYDTADFRQLATDLQSLHQLVRPEQATAPARPMGLIGRPGNTGRHDGLPAADDEEYVDDTYYGVNCTDKVIPKDPWKIPGIAQQWDEQSPTFGRYQAFSDVAACSFWPPTNPDVYRGPWNHRAANPVLVLGNYYDPATQYEFSRRITEQLGNARLLSQDAFGHCILGDSTCADRFAAEYLTDLKVPDPGQVCQPDVQPFD